MSTPTAVDRSAPVIARHEIDIDAPLDTVWQLHVDINSWPTWHPDITAAHIDGAVEPGVSFDWTSYGFSVTSTIYEVAERARVLWGGTAGGITGVHEWVFSETPSGVRVTTRGFSDAALFDPNGWLNTFVQAIRAGVQGPLFWGRRWARLPMRPSRTARAEGAVAVAISPSSPLRRPIGSCFSRRVAQARRGGRRDS